MGKVQTGCCCDGWVGDCPPEPSHTGQTTRRIPSCSSLSRCTLGAAAAGSGRGGRGRGRMEGFDMAASALEIGEVGTTAAKKTKKEEKIMCHLEVHIIIWSGGLSLGH